MIKKLEINLDNDALCEEISVALSSKIRRNILRLLKQGAYSIGEIAEKLNVPVSTTAFNVNVLKKAKLVYVTPKSNSRGNVKIVSKRVDRIVWELFTDELFDVEAKFFTFSIPIGSYVKADVQPGCGIATSNGILVADDMPGAFYSPSRYKAQILWFSKGYVEYNIPNYICIGKDIKSLSFSMELCSEAPNFRNDWPSDITFWVNGKEVCTYLSPGDFGGRRGRLNPDWWSDFSTQYGIITTIRINGEGTFLGEDLVSDVKLESLGIENGDYFTLRIGIKEDAKNQGGLNLFGEKFGDYAQGLMMRIDYSDKK